MSDSEHKDRDVNGDVDGGRDGDEVVTPAEIVALRLPVDGFFGYYPATADSLTLTYQVISALAAERVTLSPGNWHVLMAAREIVADTVNGLDKPLTTTDVPF